MELNDVFFSLQGEGLNQGLPTIFIRNSQCNLACSWCDTQFKKVNFEFSPHELLDYISKFKCNRICLTGGEPLLEEQLIFFLNLAKKYNYNVSIETNGSLDIADYLDYEIVMDIKCPSSGMSDKMFFRNLYLLKPTDQVRFVIGDYNDYDYAKNVLKNYYTKGQVLFSVCWDKLGALGQVLAEKILEDNLWNVRLQVQLHNILKLK